MKDMAEITKEEYEQMLKDCGFLRAFQSSSGIMINNFLHDLNDDRTRIKVVDSTGHPVPQKNYYDRLTPAVITEVIQLDNLLRLSSYFNDQPIIVYRGGPMLTEDALSGIVSTSLDMDIAKEFYRGSLLKLKLPAGFPYIMMDKVSTLDVFNEKEVILPPCKFKLTGVFTRPHDDFPIDHPNYYKGYELSVQPQSLARTLLERMKNPPEDYYFGPSSPDKAEYKEAMKMLKTYVKHYVDKGKFLTPAEPENL